MKKNYYVIYDGNCNLCVTFTQLLESFDKGQLFNYIPMQDTATLKQFSISEADCALGMILIDATNPEKRWQGSEAAAEITRLLPMGNIFIAAYRSLPGIKWIGDRTYTQIRDHRYQWFGKRDATYYSTFCQSCNHTPPN
ncbi:MAG: DUF393 domain-containing protein [Gomphosphaeria aponina SAG 52.96 = DSM 107014]|uniref:DUF393 domain-containing protein n=1 Tax=Gomphosphaeria aponina SAG 52.96 = DSM 107014 TaxID=1521640 RepID=A0A941JP73_9CHRO|nr:DUF393 domain-containing protein [Gomphosphaeria aponina SAG 52.96 = DSM 107014]